VKFIREKVAATGAYTKAMESFQAALRAVDGQLEIVGNSVREAQPKFMRETGNVRRAAGFRIGGIGKLVPDAPTVKVWFGTACRVWKGAHGLAQKIQAARAELQAALAKADEWNHAAELKESLNGILSAQTYLEDFLKAYAAPATALGRPLKAAVDESTGTKGWDALVSISQNLDGLWKALKETAVYTAMRKDLEKALIEIDAGNGKVQDEKFGELSKEVRLWWERLRPDEPTFFDGVQRRSSKARRTIDLKVSLSAKEDRSDPKIRDAIAVFSQSQLHCLGLSLFLARAVQEGTGFVVLDEPVLASDDDHRPNFATSVIEGLLREGIQLIVSTQDYTSWKDIGDRWGHLGVSQFLLISDDVVMGTEIRDRNDDLGAMLAKAQPFIKSQDPELRKEGARRVWDGIERFCKMMLVKDRRAKGDGMASITDYDGKNFGNCGQQVMGMLTKDPADPGKLRGAHAYVTPGPHDDTPPSTGQLACAFGDLKKLKKDYVD